MVGQTRPKAAEIRRPERTVADRSADGRTVRVVQADGRTGPDSRSGLPRDSRAVGATTAMSLRPVSACAGRSFTATLALERCGRG